MNKLETLAFYNAANNGDIHVSRQFIKYIVDRDFAKSYVYHHRNSKRLLLDLPQVEIRPISEDHSLDNHLGVCKDAGGNIAVNTWYVASPVWHGCTLNTLYALFEARLLELFGHKIEEPIEFFVPDVDFSRFEIVNCKAFLRNSPFKRKVLVCNGKPMSGQTAMTPEALMRGLQSVASEYSDTLFLVTNKEFQLRGSFRNIVFTPDIIGLPAGSNDLNENGFISTECDVIVGMASGAYTFSYLKSNFSNPAKTMLCFAGDRAVAEWVNPNTSIKAKIVTSSCTHASDVSVALREVLTWR